MSDTLAIRAKEEGSTAWSSGDYPKALTKFSEAIDYSNPTTDKEFLKILYSNRSAVYLKLNQSENALNDAKKCIELDSQWLKGHTRKGDALYAKKQYTDAYNAYNAGLRITPSDPTLTEKVEKAMRAIRNEATHTSSASSSSSWSSSGTTASSAPMTGIFRQLRLVIVVCVIVYMIPFLPFRLGGTAYRVAAGLYAGLAVYDLYKKYGMPKFSTDYAQLVIPDPNTMKAFLGMMLIMSVRPYIFAIAPVFLNEVSNFTPEIFQYILTNASAIEQKVMPMIARFAPNMASLRLNQILDARNIPMINQQLQLLGLTSEVYQGLFLIFELILPTRSFIQLYLWWQYLKMRYMLDRSGNVKRVFVGLDSNIMKLLSNSMVPAVVRQGYAAVKTFMAKQAEMPTAESAQQSGGIGSMLSKCTIM